MISRKTIQRKLIMEAVEELQNHPTAEEVYSYVAKKNPTISKATVYRNLKQLADAGEILRIENVEFADRYDHNSHKHYHFQCSECHRVYDVEMDYMSEISKSIKDNKGFTFVGHDIVFKGLCPECSKKKLQRNNS